MSRTPAPPPERGDDRWLGRTTRRRLIGPAAVLPLPWLAVTLSASASGRPAGGSSASSAFSDLAPWLAILGLLVIVGGVVLLRLRRGVREGDAAPKVGFTLHDLREMHARGELTDEEFTRARDALVAGVRRSAERPSADDDSA